MQQAFNRRCALHEPLSSIDYTISKVVYEYVVKNFDRNIQVILDYGAGECPLEPLFKYERYIPADVSQNKKGTIELFIDRSTSTIEHPSSSVDLVLAVYSLEHVLNFWDAFDEVTRVLKSGGEFFCIVPFINREHEVPYDYHRFTSFFWRQPRITKYYDELSVDKVGNFWVTVFSLWYERFWSYDRKWCMS